MRSMNPSKSPRLASGCFSTPDNRTFKAGVWSMASRPCSAFRYRSTSLRSLVPAGNTWLALAAARIHDGEGLLDRLGVGSLAQFNVFSQLLAQIFEGSAIVVEVRRHERRRRWSLHELVDRRRDARRGVAERDITNQLATNLGLGLAQALGIHPGVFDLFDGRVQGIAHVDIVLVGMIAELRVNFILHLDVVGLLPADECMVPGSLALGRQVHVLVVVHGRVGVDRPRLGGLLVVRTCAGRVNAHPSREAAAGGLGPAAVAAIATVAAPAVLARTEAPCVVPSTIATMAAHRYFDVIK